MKKKDFMRLLEDAPDDVEILVWNSEAGEFYDFTLKPQLLFLHTRDAYQYKIYTGTQTKCLGFEPQGVQNVLVCDPT